MIVIVLTLTLVGVLGVMAVRTVIVFMGVLVRIAMGMTVVMAMGMGMAVLVGMLMGVSGSVRMGVLMHMRVHMGMFMLVQRSGLVVMDVAVNQGFVGSIAAAIITHGRLL